MYKQYLHKTRSSQHTHKTKFHYQTFVVTLSIRLCLVVAWNDIIHSRFQGLASRWTHPKSFWFVNKIISRPQIFYEMKSFLLFFHILVMNGDESIFGEVHMHSCSMTNQNGITSFQVATKCSDSFSFEKLLNSTAFFSGILQINNHNWSII